MRKWGVVTLCVALGGCVTKNEIVKGSSVKLHNVRKLALAAIVLMLLATGATAFTTEQTKSLLITVTAQFAGDECPRYRTIESAVMRELIAAGFKQADTESEGFKFMRVQQFMKADEQFKKNPSAYCNAAWQLLGPSGVYYRQMLEEK
jgi:hypothetical protein